MIAPVPYHDTTRSMRMEQVVSCAWHYLSDAHGTGGIKAWDECYQGMEQAVSWYGTGSTKAWNRNSTDIASSLGVDVGVAVVMNQFLTMFTQKWSSQNFVKSKKFPYFAN